MSTATTAPPATPPAPSPKMPYAVRTVIVGPGAGRPVLCRADNGAYLTDDEAHVYEYVQHLEERVANLLAQLKEATLGEGQAAPAPAPAPAQVANPATKPTNRK